MRWGTHLNFGSYQGIARIVEPEYSSELVLNGVANLVDWRLSETLDQAAGVDNELAWAPISSSTTSILSAMSGGLLPLLSAFSSICRASLRKTGAI
jgi:hypothetical protein